MSYRIEVTDLTGRTWRTDDAPGALTDDEREAITETFSKFSEITKIELEIDQAKVWFNPAHLIAIALYESA